MDRKRYVKVEPLDFETRGFFIARVVNVSSFRQKPSSLEIFDSIPFGWSLILKAIERE